LIIEYDGIYHFKNIYGNLLQVQQKDNQLEKWCKENKWKLIRINEKTFNNVPNILNNIFQMIQNIPQLKTITKIYTIPEI
jgi:very-short-patch-repair endonuclease